MGMAFLEGIMDERTGDIFYDYRALPDKCQLYSPWMAKTISASHLDHGHTRAAFLLLPLIK
jgi:hypothetical protein